MDKVRFFIFLKHKNPDFSKFWFPLTQTQFPLKMKSVAWPQEWHIMSVELMKTNHSVNIDDNVSWISPE